MVVRETTRSCINTQKLLYILYLFVYLNRDHADKHCYIRISNATDVVCIYRASR